MLYMKTEIKARKVKTEIKARDMNRSTPAVCDVHILSNNHGSSLRTIVSCIICMADDPLLRLKTDYIAQADLPECGAPTRNLAASQKSPESAGARWRSRLLTPALGVDANWRNLVFLPLAGVNSWRQNAPTGD